MTPFWSVGIHIIEDGFLSTISCVLVMALVQLDELPFAYELVDLIMRESM